jgi:hypothetical protein
VRFPPSDLHEDLRNVADDELDIEPCEALPRHVRIYVGSWMLQHDGSTDAEVTASMKRVIELYENCGRDLFDKGPYPTTEQVVSEMLWLTREQEQ